MKNIRGEMTTQQIVMLIILIASFAVILFLLFRLNLGSENEVEICHNSVVTRGSAIVPTDAFPLECHRSYVCLTSDGSCESMTKPDKIKVKTEEEVYSALAEELATCWWMYGEGKINYVGEEALPNLYCSICAQVAFDDSLGKIFSSGTIDKKEFYEYLASHDVDGKEESYLNYFRLPEGYTDDFEGNLGDINLEKQYYVLTGMKGDVSTWGWVWRVGTGAAVVAGGLALAPFTGGGSAGVVASLIWAGGVGAAGSTAGGLLVAPIVRGDHDEQIISPSIIEIGSEQFEKLNCDSLASLN